MTDVLPDRLEVGPPSGGPRLVAHRLSAAVIAFVLTALVLLELTLVTARGWRGPAEVAAPCTSALPVVAPQDRHLPYAEVDRTDLRVRGALARVVRPRGAEGSIPGVVLVGGAGPSTRDDLADVAEALARGGLAVLTYDKRTEGYSLLHRDYGVLADDALAALDALAAQPSVRRSQVGLLGYSEGGWVVALAGERSGYGAVVPGRSGRTQVAFTVLLSAPVVTPLEQAGWLVDRRLAAAPRTLRAGAAAGLVSGRPLLPHLDTDVVPALTTSRQPTYALWGAEDHTLPVAVAVDRFQAAVPLQRGRLEIVPGAGHRVAVGSGWPERVSDWVRRGFPLDDAVRGAAPDVLVGLPTLPRPSPLGRPRLQLGLAVAAALLAGLWPRRPRRG